MSVGRTTPRGVSINCVGLTGRVDVHLHNLFVIGTTKVQIVNRIHTV